MAPFWSPRMVSCAFIQVLILVAHLVTLINAAAVSVPFHALDNHLQSNVDSLCGVSDARWLPVVLTSSPVPFVDGVSEAQTWIGVCGSKIVALSASSSGYDESFHNIDPAGSPYSTRWIFQAGSTSVASLIPFDGHDYGKLLLTASGSTWSSYRNSNSSYTCPNDPLRFSDYSAATDTFFASTDTCGIPAYNWKAAIIMRRNGGDQSVDNYCPPTYKCSQTLSVFNDGTTDHLYRSTNGQIDESIAPMQIYRQSLVNGGPQTTNSIIAVAPVNVTGICGNYYGPKLLMHPRGKMLFGACGGDNLIYVDLRDSNPSAPPNIQIISTCVRPADSSSGRMQVTNDRLYASCQKPGGSAVYTLRVYPLAVASDGSVSINEANYLDLTPLSCDATTFNVMHSPVAGRPDAVWVICGNTYNTFTNLCGFGTSSMVSAAGDTYNCTACPPNSLQVSSTGSFFADTVCTPCPSGSYVASASATSCTSCPAGSYLASPSNTTCTICPAGTYQNMTSATSCVTCPVPYIVSPVGSTTVGNCSQEICEIPGSNPLYCKSVTTAGAAVVQPPIFALVAVCLLTILAILI